MKKDDLLRSQASGGPHHRLLAMVGQWHGTARTWFAPNELADESPISGTIRAVLGGAFVVHEYSGSLQGKPLAGMAIHGYHIDTGMFEIAWIDSFHNGTAIMTSRDDGMGGHTRMSVLGHYADPAGGPDWGWRTQVEMPDSDHMVIVHYNITPGGDEAKAVEIQYIRVS